MVVSRDRLTPKQQAQLPAFRREWLKRGLSTGSYDEAVVKQAVRDLYHIEGYAIPDRFIFCDSPLGGLFAAYAVSGSPLGRALGEYLPELRGLAPTGQQQVVQLGWEIERALRVAIEPLREPPSAANALITVEGRPMFHMRGPGAALTFLQERVSEAISPAVTSVKGMIREQLAAHSVDLWRNPLDKRRLDDEWWSYRPAEVVHGARGGHLDVADIADHMFLRREGMRYSSDAELALDAFEVLCDVGYWWPYADAVVISRRPSRLRLDAHDRPHCEDGHAISYLDGFSVWALNGVMVPQAVVETPEILRVQDVLRAGNVEARRIALDRFGRDRYLSEMRAARLGSDEYGTLWRTHLPEEDEPLVMVEVVNSTPEPDGTFRNYFLRVPPTTRSAREAIAWTFALEPAQQYRPAVMS